MTPGTIIVLVILIAMVALVIVKLAKDKKSGNVCSGCLGCSGCACGETCGSFGSRENESGKSFDSIIRTENL